MKKGLLLGVLGFVLSVMLMPYTSHAVPSYARQVKKPCTACHTIWPNLTQYGRQFKVKAYTDVSQEWEMITKDNMNLATTMPLSGRVVFYPLVRQDNATRDGSTQIDSVALFLASRVFDYAGVFASAEWSPDSDTIGMPTAKMAFQYPLGEGNTVGVVFFKGLSSAADPFNALGGRDRMLSWGDESKPLVLTAGWTFDFASEGNIGTVAHGYFLGNRLYAAVGAMRGGVSADALNNNTAFNNIDPAVTTTVSSNDPNDGYFRLAWDQKLPNGAITFGATYYDGTQRIVTPTFYDSNVTRCYVDVSLEQNYGENHLFEVQALHGNGKDKNVFGGGEERNFDGLYVEGSYFYDRKFGVVAAINDIKFKDVLVGDATGHQDKIGSWLVSLNFLPWLNTKFALQYAHTKTTFVDTTPEQTDKITRLVLDMLF
jgi:hypothetical protein